MLHNGKRRTLSFITVGKGMVSWTIIEPEEIDHTDVEHKLNNRLVTTGGLQQDCFNQHFSSDETGDWKE